MKSYFLCISLLLIILTTTLTFCDDIQDPDMIIDVSFILSKPFGITYDWNSDRLWVSSGRYQVDKIYKITIEENPSVELNFLVSGGPNLILGLAYLYEDDTNKLYFNGNDNEIYWVETDGGEPYEAVHYRSTPLDWGGNQGLAINNINPTIYSCDWNLDEIGYAQPPETGDWITLSATNISGLGCGFSPSEDPDSLWAVSQSYSNASLYQYILNNGVVTGEVYEHNFPEGYLSDDTGDCAYDGQYLYVVNQEDALIYRFDMTGYAIQSQSLGLIKSLFAE